MTVRAAIYLRVSTDEQAGSIETQERGALAWCAREGHAVVATYRDVSSGAEWVHRTGIADLQRDATRSPRPWDVVVVRDVDRLGRDAVRLPLLLSVLRDHGIAVVEYSTGQPVALDGVGQLVASVRACIAQIERETIAHRVRTAHATQHQAGRVVGGAVYGYRNVRTAAGVHYEIDEGEAAIVRELFARAGRGEGMREIALALNARCVPSPSSGRRGTGTWSPSAVHEILRSERYRGVLVWGATRKEYRGGTRIRRANASVTRVEAPALAIVTAAEWDAAQRHRSDVLRAQDRPPRRGASPRHLLVGFATCAACGGPLGTTATRQGRQTVPAYACLWHRDRGTCGATWRRWTERIDSVVREWLVRDVLDEDLVRDAVAEARRRLLSAEPDPRVETLRAEERETTAAIGRLVAAIEHGGDVPELAARLGERRDRLASVRAELASCAGAAQAIPLDLDALLAGAVRDLREHLASDVVRARAVLGAVLVGRLRVAWEGPRGRLWLEGRAELGGVLRAAVTGGMEASPEGVGRTPRPALAEIALRVSV